MAVEVFVDTQPLRNICNVRTPSVVIFVTVVNESVCEIAVALLVSYGGRPRKAQI